MIEVVCGVIQNAEGQFLACLRPPGKHLAGRWEFPGGKVDQGESHEQALIRELREELAILVEIRQALTQVDWSYGEKWIRLCPFLCEIIDGEPQALEHEKLVWCAPEDLATLVWAEADEPILREILSRDVTRVTTLGRGLWENPE